MDDSSASTTHRMGDRVVQPEVVDTLKEEEVEDQAMVATEDTMHQEGRAGATPTSPRTVVETISPCTVDSSTSKKDKVSSTRTRGTVKARGKGKGKGRVAATHTDNTMDSRVVARIDTNESHELSSERAPS